MRPARSIEIEPDHAGQRVDNFLLRELAGLPRSRIYQMIRRGEVRVNGGRVRASTRLQSGDALRVPPTTVGSERQAVGGSGLAELLAASILYEDADLIALDKPHGVAVHGGSGIGGAVIETLRQHRGEPNLELVHRLDRDTSGCLLVARRRPALRRLHAALRERSAEKTYVALVHGQPTVGLIEAPLLVTQRANERYVLVGEDGQASRTRIIAVAPVAECARVTMALETGRTHQARVHLRHVGAPVVGDERYGSAPQDAMVFGRGVPVRLYLHAWRIAIDGKAFEAPLPDAFATAESALRVSVR